MGRTQAFSLVDCCLPATLLLLCRIVRHLFEAGALSSPAIQQCLRSDGPCRLGKWFHGMVGSYPDNASLAHPTLAPILAEARWYVCIQGAIALR